MTSLQQLNAYLSGLERRLRLHAATRGAAAAASIALLLTIVLVWVGNRFAFAQNIVLPLRILLFTAVGFAIAALLGWPVYRLNRRRVLQVAEQAAPEFQQRLLTAQERSVAGDAWSELLAEDALRVAREQPSERFVSPKQIYGFSFGLLAAVSLLLWMVTAGPGYWGYGAGLLWTGSGNVSKRPLYDIAVSPGNKTIRRKTDQVITAHLNGFAAERVDLFVKYGTSLKWDRTVMRRAADGEQYRFLFAGLSDQVEYYVAANHATSQHFTINVKDLPAVKHMKVALNFPGGLGLQNVVLEPSGDIRAVIGTVAKISVLTDRRLERGQLVFDNGKKLSLTPGEGNWLSASLPIEKDGSYHVVALDGAESIRISDDYIIEARKDEAPSVKILRPGGDPKVSPIEEVPVTVTASDDYGVQDLQLHYSVNGGPEQTAALLKNRGAKEAEGKTTLYFENFKVAPGDMVSFYATAKDAKTTTHSDIVFAQAEPFDYKFSQSQQSGGGGGGAGNESNDISKRQKQVIAATFNEINDKTKTRSIIAEDGKFLSELQSKLGTQAKTLSDRMSSREMGAAGSQFQQFSQLMTQASADMSAAANQLETGKWKEALAPEQKALTSLLRADALFRDIQVAYNQMGGGGGGGSGAQRDLARMLDLELDNSKNQYETGQTAQPASAEEKSNALDDAFEKLQALARRQQELAAQNAQQQAFEQRWQEEQLRREAEELRQELQKLAQDSQQGSQSGQQQGQQGQSGQQGQQGQQGQSGQQQGGSRGGQQTASGGSAGGGQRQAEALQRAGNSLNQAEEEMRKAAGNNDQGARERAAARMRDAQQQISQLMRDQSGKSVADLQAQAQQMADAQRALAERMKQMYGADNPKNALRNFMAGGENGEGMPQMNDPNSRSYGYGFRRPSNANQMRPPHQPTDAESAVANEKEKLAAQLEQLQRQMQAQSRSLSASRPDASSKLSRALSEAEGKELAVRMQKNAEWMRQGYGDRNLRMEDSVTSGMDQLNRDLKGVRDTLNGAPGAGDKQSQKTAQALAEVQDLRAQLERQRASQNGQSQQNGQGGSPQRGSSSGPGEGQRGGEDSSRSGNGQLALGRPGMGGGGGNEETLSREGVQNTIRQLNGLRAQTNPTDHALYGSIDGALGNLQHLTGAQDGLLDTRLSQNALSSLQRLEVELSKRLGQDSAAGTRTSAHEISPDQYRDAVAGYFRKLSQTGNNGTASAK